jgi:glycosyltransferase involved in cell wall biosynthesis
MPEASGPIERPLVSVGMPTYERPADLARALAAMTGQTHDRLEIVVSDNASTSPAVEATARAFAERDPRVRYVRQPVNRGPVENFQYVLAAATGAYFMWCSDDDWRAPTFVERLLAALEANPAAPLAFCDFHAVDGDDRRRPEYPPQLPLLEPLTAASRRERQWAYFMQEESLGKANAIYGLMRREALAGFDWARFCGQHGWFGSDMLFVFRMLGLGPLALVREVLFHARVGNVKHYRLPTESSAHAWRRRASRVRTTVRYIGEYARIAAPEDRMRYVAGRPLKLARFVGRRLGPRG